MIKKFFKDTTNLTLVHFLSQAVALITFPIYSRFLDMDEYGLYDYLILVGVLGASICTLESHQGVLRLFAGRTSEAEKQRLASSVWLFNLLVGLVIATGVIVAAYATEGLLFGITADPIVYVVAAVAWLLTLLRQQLMSLHRARLDTTTVARAALWGFCVQVPTGIITIVVLQVGVLGLFLSVAAGMGLQCCLLAAKGRGLLRPIIDVAVLKEVFRFSAPLVLSSFGAMGWMYCDRYIANAYVGLYGVGLLGVAYRITGPVALLSSAIGMALSPLVYAYHEQKETVRDMARLFEYYVAMSMIVVLGFAGYGDLVLRILAPPEYYEASRVFSFIAIALLTRGAYQFFPGLIVAKKTGVYALIQLAGLAVNIGISLALVRTYGVLGLCLASVMSGVCVFAVLVLAGQRHLRMQVPVLRIGVAVIATAVLVVVLHVGRESSLGLRALGYAAPVLGLFLAVGLRLVSVADMLQLLQRKRS